MRRFVEGMNRGQSTLFPECLDDWICGDKPVRVIDAFVEELDLGELKFCGVDREGNRQHTHGGAPPTGNAAIRLR
jgi:transposase